MCLFWDQISEYFYQIYLLGCIYIYNKNILETKSLTFMEKLHFLFETKGKFHFSYFFFRFHLCQFLFKPLET